MTDNTPRFFGKYRGTVSNNLDPEQRGRIQVVVPDVLGAVPSTWALPCLPLASLQLGASFLPDAGSSVWIEFEQGDPDFPIWTGCFWNSAAEMPSLARVLIKTLSGASLSITEAGIIIQNAQGASIALIGPSVSMNGDALVVD